MKNVTYEKLKLSIGGIGQYLFFQYASKDAPVMLFLHGGPGTAQIQFARKLHRHLVNDFIVVDWDQRGAGYSYAQKLTPDSMTIDQLVSDTQEVVKAVLEHFQKRKLILVGHSWGTILGFKVSKLMPESIAAYIGMAQIVNMKKGELVSYEYCLTEAQNRGDAKALKALEAMGPPPFKKLDDGRIQRELLAKFGGLTFDGSGISKIFKFLSLRDTSLLGFFKFIKGIMFSLKSLEDEQMAVDFENESLPPGLPAYFFCGRNDYTVPTRLVEQFVSESDNPMFKLIRFEKSGHLPNYEEPELFAEHCRQVKREIGI